MANIFDLAASASSITAINGVSVAEGMDADKVNDAIRELAAACFNTFDPALENFLAGTAGIPITQGGTGATSLSGAQTALGILVEATTAQIRANTADKAVSTDQAWGAIASVALTDGASVAIDMSLGINFTLTIGGNRTLALPTNMKEGQSGAIDITQDGTGSRTLAYASGWKFAGGTAPTLSTAAGTKDTLYYRVLPGATTVYGTLVKAIA